ncbi:MULTISPECIES: sensor of ECF-type sigma factor [Flavobacterium]|uniref:Sensor of ECF-type sigma factor n=1 Tax=Flavobacterium columnare TaxID=996 RepID=A0AA94F1C9_9FLAO|nr:sensor of ECF-type sigma factor [Flavobacterium columnare]MCH4830804.1 sensor of ECF-type sigma factor [Flavobacterium columnare]MCH4833258.1 sensor of ECF-type sigma factor [Flavobacterium columnare]
MKKIITFLIIILNQITFGQGREEKMEKIKTLRIAFISDKLNLTSEEAQKFWPIFNKFDDTQLELQKQKKKLIHQLNTENTNSLSDKEMQNLMDQEEKIENEIRQNKRSLVKNLQGIIPNQKIIQLKQIEIEFKHKLLNQIKERKQKRF